MTSPFSLYQTATCLIREERHAEAAALLRKAVRTLDKNPRHKDAYMRDDLANLAERLEARAA